YELFALAGNHATVQLRHVIARLMSFGGNGSIVASANMKKVKRHDASAHSASYTLDDRLVVRDQFNLSPEYIHLATFALASHPQPVLEAIQKVPPCKLALSEEPACRRYGFVQEADNVCDARLRQSYSVGL